MDVNIALGLLAALVVLTSQPYNTEGRNIICRKDLRKLQKRSGEGVVLLEGYEITPKDEERDGDCVEYETASPFPAPAVQTTTMQAPNTVKPVTKKTSKNQCWVYGKPMKLYLHMRKRPTLPNSQGNGVVSGPFTGGKKSFVNTQPRVVCGKVQISVPKGLQEAIKLSVSGSSSFCNFLRSFQGVLAAQRTRGSSIYSRCF